MNPESPEQIDPQERERLVRLSQDAPGLLVEMVLELKVTVAGLERELAALKEKQAKNSRNSSKPPSSDGPDKPKPKSLRKRSGRRPGAQPGHKGETLRRAEKPDHTLKHDLQNCPLTGRPLCDEDIIGEVRRQVFDLPEPHLEVTEHVAYIYRVPGGTGTVTAPFPDGVNAPVQYGPNFEAFLVYLRDYQLLPMRRIRQLCHDLFGFAVAEGTIHKARARSYESLGAFEESAKEQLGAEAVLHADETGIKVGKERWWLHTVGSENLTLYLAHPSRGMVAVEEMGVLPGYQGRLIHDCYATYFSLGCEHGLCNAHLLRELLFQEEEQGQDWAAQMGAFLEQACASSRGESWAGERSLAGWNIWYGRIVAAGYRENGKTGPPPPGGRPGRSKQPKVLNLLDRLHKHRDKVLAFLADPAVPFTNNQGEQDLRMTKVQQKISGPFRSAEGAAYFARTRSYISTAIKRGVSVFRALCYATHGEPLFIK